MLSEYILKLREELVGHMPLVLSVAGAILLDSKDRVLLHHRCDNDTWSIPGGIVEPGEMVESTVKREVLEETGLSLENIELFNIYSDPSQHYVYPNEDEVHFVNIVYYTRTFFGQTQIDRVETKDIKFFDVNNLPKELSPPIKVILEDLKNRINNKLLK